MTTHDPPCLRPRRPLVAVRGTGGRAQPLLAPAGLAGKKILVVDDDVRNITPNVDVVRVDIMMPVMDGDETMRLMRTLPAPGRLAIVALTALTGSGERERCIDAGACAYIAKPVENGPDFLVALGDCLRAAATAEAASEVVR